MVKFTSLRLIFYYYYFYLVLSILLQQLIIQGMMGQIQGWAWLGVANEQVLFPR